MRWHFFSFPVFAVALSTAAVAQANYVGASGSIQIDKTTQVPGDTIKAGSYSITIPEQIADRVIVRIDSTNSKDHAIFLGVPSSAAKMGGGNGALTWENGPGKGPALRGYVFPTGNAVEFVYPKAEAAALAKNNAATVVAVDPRSEGRAQLKSLSKDELEIVNLWLLSLTTAGPDNRQPAILARHYDPAQNTSVASVAAPIAPVPSAAPGSQRQTAQSLPIRGASKGTPVATRQATVATNATIAPVAPQAVPVPKARMNPPAAKNSPEVAKLEQPESVGVRRRPALAQLPHTASSLPLVWMVGLISLLALGALRIGRLRLRGVGR